MVTVTKLKIPGYPDLYLKVYFDKPPKSKKRSSRSRKVNSSSGKSKRKRSRSRRVGSGLSAKIPSRTRVSGSRYSKFKRKHSGTIRSPSSLSRSRRKRVDEELDILLAEYERLQRVSSEREPEEDWDQYIGGRGRPAVRPIPLQQPRTYADRMRNPDWTKVVGRKA